MPSVLTLAPRLLPLAALLALTALLALAACQTAPQADDVPQMTDSTAAAPQPGAGLPETDLAAAALTPLGDSGVSGTVEFRRLGRATEIRYTLDGLAPGDHGFHLHDNADCGADSTGEPGSAAGAHFNPAASPHGAPSAKITGRHAGDFGNVTADAQGHAEGIAIDSVLTFGGPTSLLGHAVIVHETADDLETQPSGDAGARVACGVVETRSGRGA